MWFCTSLQPLTITLTLTDPTYLLSHQFNLVPSCFKKKYKHFLFFCAVNFSSFYSRLSRGVTWKFFFVLSYIFKIKKVPADAPFKCAWTNMNCSNFSLPQKYISSGSNDEWRQNLLYNFFVVIKNCDTYNVDYVAMKTKMTTTTTAAATSHIPHVTLYFR